MAVGTAVVAVTAVLAKMFLFGDKKKKTQVTLQDPTVKYPLKLIDREVINFVCTGERVFCCLIQLSLNPSGWLGLHVLFFVLPCILLLFLFCQSTGPPLGL